MNKPLSDAELLLAFDIGLDNMVFYAEHSVLDPSPERAWREALRDVRALQKDIERRRRNAIEEEKHRRKRDGR